MSLLEARSLCKFYHAGSRSEVRAVDDLSLTIERGSITVLTGPSGSGKTTLLALLGALERPTSGIVQFDGRDLSRCSDMELTRCRRRMGFVSQDFSLIPNLSSEENITYALIPRGVSRAERKQRARELLSQLGIADMLSVKACELSGGEQQRVAIARALAGRPEVLFADEPTSNLDAETSRAFLALLRDYSKTGKTLVMAAHDQQVLAMATHEHDLEKGKLKASAQRGNEPDSIASAEDSQNLT